MTNEVELIFQNEKHPKVHEELFKRYGVAVRDRQQVVEHAVNRCKTIISPHQFALYEVALKANYIDHEFGMRKVKEQGRDDVIFMGPSDWHQQIAEKDGFTLPAFDPSWTEKRWKQAVEDYHYVARQFHKMVGKDAHSGKDRDLYYALLD
jgi:hypothetical protein